MVYIKKYKYCKIYNNKIKYMIMKKIIAGTQGKGGVELRDSREGLSDIYRKLRVDTCLETDGIDRPAVQISPCRTTRSLITKVLTNKNVKRTNGESDGWYIYTLTDALGVKKEVDVFFHPGPIGSHAQHCYVVNLRLTVTQDSGEPKILEMKGVAKFQTMAGDMSSKPMSLAELNEEFRMNEIIGNLDEVPTCVAAPMALLQGVEMHGRRRTCLLVEHVSHGDLFSVVVNKKFPYWQNRLAGSGKNDPIDYQYFHLRFAYDFVAPYKELADIGLVQEDLKLENMLMMRYDKTIKFRIFDLIQRKMGSPGPVRVYSVPSFHPGLMQDDVQIDEKHVIYMIGWELIMSIAYKRRENMLEDASRQVADRINSQATGDEKREVIRKCKLDSSLLKEGQTFGHYNFLVEFLRYLDSREQVEALSTNTDLYWPVVEENLKKNYLKSVDYKPEGLKEGEETLTDILIWMVRRGETEDEKTFDLLVSKLTKLISLMEKKSAGDTQLNHERYLSLWDKILANFLGR
ncbi:MAG: hypothetical protein CL521_00975 [Actinobacteria bacterium]|nr:hypothetical protein [Actinomycetota bacterium]